MTVVGRKPPETWTMRFCPVCGRTDGSDLLRDSHYAGGKKCPGTPCVATYQLVEVATARER